MSQLSSSLSIAGTDDPIVIASQVSRLGGAVKVLTRAQFDAAVTAERTRVTNNGTGIYANGEQFHIIDEVGHRTWTLATGGSNAANAAASHARNVVLPSGMPVMLAGDANTATSGAGAPGAGVGAVGDLVLDPSAGLTYTKTGGAVWGAGASAGGGGGGVSAASPAFTGVPTAPTAAPGTNTTQLATTAFVTAADALKASLSSPALTGAPTAPTATAGTNTTQLATTAFVAAALFSPLSFTATTFDGSNRITAYTLNGQAHTVVYPTSTTFTVTNTVTSATRNGTLNGSAQLIGLA